MAIKLFVTCDPSNHTQEEKLLTSVPGVSFDVIYSNGSNKDLIGTCDAYVFAISLKSLHGSSAYSEYNQAEATLGKNKIYVTNMELGLKPNFMFPASHAIWAILADPTHGGYGANFKKVLAALAVSGGDDTPVVKKEEEPIPAPVEEEPVVEEPTVEAPVVEEAPIVDAEPEGGFVDAEPEEEGGFVDAEPEDDDIPFDVPEDE